MIRLLILMMVLIIVFLTGMLMGMDREQSSYSMPLEEEQEEMVPLFNQTESYVSDDQKLYEDEVSETSNEQLERSSSHFIENLALFLEKIVKGFYEIIVELLYQITRLFL